MKPTNMLECRARSRGRKLGRRRSVVTTIDIRTDPVTARCHRVVSLVTHVDIPDIVWAKDETGCYGVLGRDAKGKQIVVERFGPIRIVTARR
jgi:hypothetical protein